MAMATCIQKWRTDRKDPLTAKTIQEAGPEWCPECRLIVEEIFSGDKSLTISEVIEKHPCRWVRRT